MKAILEFNLEEDRSDFTLAVNASKWYSVVWDMDQYLRTRLKYEDSINDQEYEAVEKAREHLFSLMRESGISFDDVA